jgi:hypothetical protein
MTNDEDKLEKTIRAIRQYIEDFPRAADNLLGIANWWFEDDQFRPSMKLVEKALAHLINEGSIVDKKSVGGEVIYVKAPTPADGPREL